MRRAAIGVVVALGLVPLAAPADPVVEERTYVGPSPSAVCLTADTCIGGAEIPVPAQKDTVKITIIDTAVEPVEGFFFLWDEEEILVSGSFCGTITVPIPKGTVRLRVAVGASLACEFPGPATVGTIRARFT